MKSWFNFEKLLVLIFGSLFKIGLLIKLNNFPETFRHPTFPEEMSFGTCAKNFPQQFTCKIPFEIL